MNRTNTNWITQPEIQPNLKDDILTIEFPIPSDMKFRFLSVMTFGNEAELGKIEAKELEEFLEQLFKEFGETWSEHPKIKIQAIIERPFVLKKKMRMKDRATAAEFYKRLSEKLNQLMPNGAPVLPATLASSGQSTGNPGAPHATFFKKRPSQPPLDGIIIIQEDGGNGT